jgi:hypothetical protein
MVKVCKGSRISLMRQIMSVLAGVLSLAMLSSSASALVCDLSCSLGPTHADCTIAVQAGRDARGTASASSDMNMAGMEMASENAEQMPAEGTGFRGRPSAAPQCVHPLCSQASSTALRFSGDRSTSRRLGAAWQPSAEPPAALIHLHHVKFEISPPEVFTADPPITTLRI